MHLLFVALSFPSAEFPHHSPFIKEQVRLLCECKQVRRITVLSPTTYVPRFMRRFHRASAQAVLPRRYELAGNRCEVLFPRYIKAPGGVLLSWTIVQWCRIVERTVARFINTDPVSLIHANAGSVSSWAAISTAQKYHLPCVATYQGSEVHVTLAQQKKGWRLCRDSFRLADLNLPVSRSLERILRSYVQPNGRCEVVLRGVDQTLFVPSAKLSADPHVAFVGHIVEAKGVFDLLSAWTRVSHVCPNASLTMIGQDLTGGRFLREARSAGVARSIKLTGAVPLQTVADLMRQSRIFCLPSHGEGTPNSVMEALSCGLPIVATDVGGIPDIVEHGKSGLLLKNGDVLNLANSLITLLEDYDRCVAMGKTAQLFARDHLDARKTVRRLAQLYDELIAARSEKTK
jgi:teichuronic acid biosynthesis glycosyltransferase TuaC